MRPGPLEVLHFLDPIAAQGPPGRSPGPPARGLKDGNHRICPECLNSRIRIALFSYKNRPVQPQAPPPLPPTPRWRCGSSVILHALPGTGPRFFDSVGKVKTRLLKYRVNLRAYRAPGSHFPERGGGSGNGPRLSLGNGATSGPKVTCFTIYFLAGSHRLRARAPGMRESSTGVADPGPPP